DLSIRDLQRGRLYRTREVRRFLAHRARQDHAGARALRRPRWQAGGTSVLGERFQCGGGGVRYGRSATPFLVAETLVMKRMRNTLAGALAFGLLATSVALAAPAAPAAPGPAPAPTAPIQPSETKTFG